MSTAEKRPDVQDRARRILKQLGETENSAPLLNIRFNYETDVDRIVAGIKAEEHRAWEGPIFRYPPPEPVHFDVETMSSGFAERMQNARSDGRKVMNDERYEDILKQIKTIVEEYENAGIVNVIEVEIFLMLTGLHNLLQAYNIALARTEEFKKRLKGNIDNRRLGVQAMAEFQSIDDFVGYMTWRARHIRNFMMEELRWPRIKTKK